MAVAQISVLLIAAVGEIGSQIINKQVEFLSNLVSKIIGGGDDMEGAGEDLMTKLQDGFSSIIESIGPWISDKISSLVTIIKNKVTDFTNAGKSLMEGLANGIKNAASLAVTSMTGAAGLVVNAANSKFEINSPSHVFERIGSGLVEGLELGWDENIDDLNKDINKDMKYDAELNVDTNRNFNTTTITKASTLSDTDISKLAAALSVNVSNVTYLDSKEIGASTYNVVKEKTLDETKALNLATGGAYNV
jgi:phage-related protein